LSELAQTSNDTSRLRLYSMHISTCSDRPDLTRYAIFQPETATNLLFNTRGIAARADLTFPSSGFDNRFHNAFEIG